MIPWSTLFSTRRWTRRGWRIRVRLPRIHRKYAIFLTTSSAFALALFHRMALAAIASDLMTQFDLSAGKMGSLGSYYFYAYALMQIPIGLVVDRVGSRRLLTVCLAVATAGGFIFATASSYAWLSVGRILIGLGASGIFIPTLKLITTWFLARDLALWNGMFLAAAYAGALLAGRPLVEISQHIGWSGALLGASVLTGVITICAWAIVRDEPEAQDALHPMEAPRWGERRISLLGSLGYALRSPVLWLLSLGAFMVAGTQASFQAVWAGPFLTDVYHLTPALVGNLLMLIPAGQIVGNLISGWLADRVFHSRPAANIVGLILFVLLWLPLALSTASIGAAGLGGIYIGFGYIVGSFALLYPIIRDVFPVEVASAGTGFLNLMAMMGGAIFQQVFGALLDRFVPVDGVYPVDAYQLAFSVGLVMALLGLLSVAAGLVARTRHSRTSEPLTQP